MKVVSRYDRCKEKKLQYFHQSDFRVLVCDADKFTIEWVCAKFFRQLPDEVRRVVLDNPLQKRLFFLQLSRRDVGLKFSIKEDTARGRKKEEERTPRAKTLITPPPPPSASR